MASVSKYSTAAGETRWMVRYRKPDRGTTTKRGFTTKRAAEAHANTIETQKMTGAYVAPTLGRITVAELAPNWLARKKTFVAASHYRTLESAWRVHVKPAWGRVPVADVDLLAVEQWISTMTADGSGHTTVTRAYGVLSGILTDAVKGKRLTANPALGVGNLPKKTQRRHIYLSADDVARLAEASGDNEALVLTLAYCGLRWGEAIGLRVRDVEFLRRRLTVSENAVQISGQHVVGPTKGRKNRSVPVPQFVLTELSRQCEGKGPTDLVFDGRGGRYMRRSNTVTGWFQAAVKKAKVQTITPHDLRHTCASLSVSAGVNVLALQRMLGHESAKMTLDTYADLFDDDLDAVANALHARYAPDALKTCSQAT